ncbi:hypothetical protein GCM10025734_04460 [Kitasatospora paranensis]
MRKWGQRAPWWLVLLLGVACAVLGAVIVLQPFTSLSVLRLFIVIVLAVSGVADLASACRSRSARWTVAVGVLWLVTALVAAVFPGLTLRVLALVVGLALVAGGMARLVGAVRGRGDERAAHVLGALASVVFGCLALAWPDVTLLVVAVVFGARTFVFGCARIVEAVRAAHEGGRRENEGVGGGRGWLHGWPRTAAMAASLVVALALLALSAALHRASPSPTAFYTRPASVPATAGALLRSEPFTRAVPASAQAWKILYTTTRDDGVPAVASGIVLVSRSAPAGPRPVIAWAHGTTGVASSCAPSLLQKPFEAGRCPRWTRSSRMAGSWWPPTTRAWAPRARIPTWSGRARRAPSWTPSAPPGTWPRCTFPTRRRSGAIPRVAMPRCGPASSSRPTPLTCRWPVWPHWRRPAT